MLAYVNMIFLIVKNASIKGHILISVYNNISGKMQAHLL